MKPRNYALSYLFVTRAARIPFPNHLKLFISKIDYDYKIPDLLGIVAYYVEEYREGMHAVRKAMKIAPMNARLKNNMRIYKRVLDFSLSLCSGKMTRKMQHRMKNDEKNSAKSRNEKFYTNNSEVN